MATNGVDHTSYLHTPTATPFSSLTIPQCLDKQANSYPDKEAYVCRVTGLPRQAITFAELKAKTDHIASSLIKLGLRPGSKVILSGVSSIDWIISDLAVIKAGLISVRLSLNINQTTPEAISRVINQNNAVALLYYPGDYNEHQDYLQRTFPELKEAGTGAVKSKQLPTLQYFISMKQDTSDKNMTVGNLLQTPIDPLALTARQSAIESDDIVTITFTAGSELKPKSVPHSHFNWVNFYITVFGQMLDSPNDRFYSDRSLSWFDSFVHLPVLTGATIVCVRSETTVAKQHAALQYRLLQEEKCNSGLFLPYFLQDLVEQLEKQTYQKAEPLTWGLIWGDVAQKDTLMKATALIKRFEIAYGSVEAMLATHYRWDASNPESLGRMGCVGGPAPGVEIKVINNAGRKLPRGGYGEICVRSPFAFNMYHHCVDGMMKDVNGWIKTGDYGYTSKENLLHILARKSQLINRPIATCVPAVVEEVILKYPGVMKVAVFALQTDQPGIDSVCCCVAKKEGNDFDSDALNKFCNDPKESLLAPEVIPSNFLFSNSFPNMNGKVDKKTLRKWATEKLFNRNKVKK